LIRHDLRERACLAARWKFFVLLVSDRLRLPLPAPAEQT
jgi:hypothetical protein